MTSMGVEISVNKTHVSKDTYEFAKRWIRPFRKTGNHWCTYKGYCNNIQNPLQYLQYCMIKGNH
jgi:hypothetical protein